MNDEKRSRVFVIVSLYTGSSMRFVTNNEVELGQTGRLRIGYNLH
jgi:hypothetical protein